MYVHQRVVYSNRIYQLLFSVYYLQAFLRAFEMYC